MPTALRLDHALLGAALALTALLFTRDAADPVNVIKLTALMLCTIALVTTAALRVVRTRVALVPWGPAAWIGAALLAAFVVAAVTAPVLHTAVLGSYGRNSGLLAYGSAILLFLLGLRILERRTAGVLLYTLAGTGLLLAIYGLFQLAGVDLVPWKNPDFNPMIATLGNPNFAAAYLAICAPAGAWLALRHTLDLFWRITGGVAAFLCVLAASLSEAFQGPLAASAGLFVLAIAWVLNQPERVRRAGLGVLAAAAALGAAVVAAGLAGFGPVAGVITSAGGRARGWYWEAALTMFREDPLLGVGLEAYGGSWWWAKPLEVERTIGDGNFVNAAHSVPLHLLATGGLLLALAYAAFVGYVAFALVTGLLRLRGQERLLLGALGGCWAAYQVQSWVSIDQVPLLTAQYICAAGVVVVAGRSRLRPVRLPGAPPKVLPAKGRPGQGKARKAARRPSARALGGVDYALVAVIAVAALALAWQSLSPLRSDLALREGDRGKAAGDSARSLRAYDRAQTLVPGSALPLQRKARLLKTDQPERAYPMLRQAVALDPFNRGLLREAAEFAEGAGEIPQAREHHEQAVALEPEGGRTLLAAAQFELRHGEPGKAVDLLERAARLFPGDGEISAALDEARAQRGAAA